MLSTCAPFTNHMFQKQEITAGCLLFVSFLELIPRDQEVSLELELVEKVVPTKFHIVHCRGNSVVIYKPFKVSQGR